MTKCTTPSASFPRCKGRQIIARFDGGDVTSDGGILLLRQLDREMGLTRAVARRLSDERDAQRCLHRTETLVRQRVFGLALGYEDLNDHHALRHDIALQTAVDTDGVLASQSTLCRFEQQADRDWAITIHEEMIEQFIRSFRRPPKKPLYLDFDATDDRVHGQQLGRHFNGYYNHYIFLPLFVFCGDQLLVSYLRPASLDAAHHAGAILALLVRRLRQAWPEVKIVFRGDSGFCRPLILNWCDRHGVDYIIGLAGNKRLAKLALDIDYESAIRFEKSWEKERVFGFIEYAAKSWKERRRRVIVKSETSRRGFNTRYVVTSLRGCSAEWLYDHRYCARGEMENRIKEQQFLFSDRTSCHEWWPNQYRLLLSGLAYLLLEQPMQRRFSADRHVQAVLLLLQERIPRANALFTHVARLAEVHTASNRSDPPIRVFDSADTPTPAVQLLSNGRYHVMITNAGGGYSRWQDLAVTRWREDPTRDHHGTFCYLRDLDSGHVWSNTYQPTCSDATHYQAIFAEGRAEYRRRDRAGSGDVETYTEIAVSPEDDIELRRLRLTNHTAQRCDLEVTSYAEVVIAPVASDALHPAFSNLFVQTEIIAPHSAILCHRRSRAPEDRSAWMFQLLIVRDTPSPAASYETDRLEFIGRCRDSAAPQAMERPGELSGHAGAVLDPIAAIRRCFSVEPHHAVTLDLVTGMAGSRADAEYLIAKYQDRHLADRVFELTWTHRQVVLEQLDASEADAQLHARLASAVVYAHPALRADPAIIAANRRGQSALWSYAISGDLPIVLLRVGSSASLTLVRQLIQAHAHWRLQGLAVDLVIWNEEYAVYRQQLQEQILGLIASGSGASQIDRPGGIFVRPLEQIAGEDRLLFLAVARAIILDSHGSLEEQLDQRQRQDARPPLLRVTDTRPPAPGSIPVAPQGLILSNPLGAFSANGQEYVIQLGPNQRTPAPWVNVIANPDFGCVISESGGSYTWSINAHENRLTPWHNDPVSDPSGEALYLRDEESGHVWSATPLPVRRDAAYLVRHGFGYSVFESEQDGIRTQLWIYVALDASIKFSVLKVSNLSARARNLSVTGYVEWVLGDLPAKTAMHVTTEIAAASGALLAHNVFHRELSEQVAFFDVHDPTRTLSGDRQEFIGRNGSPAQPAALQRTHLSGTVGAGLDPCAALQIKLSLAPDESREVIFRLGVGGDREQADALIQRYRAVGAAGRALDEVQAHWRQTLGALQIETPDPALDVMVNGWLLYQTLACRLWARSGYYQSGGAFGFRDQLQDSMALAHAAPERLRDQLLLCASRQFREGDVQHWWHPPQGRGVRTRCSDDYLWLPLALCRYVRLTDDTDVLDDPVPFLEGRAVGRDDEAYFDLPGLAPGEATLYQHAQLALRHGLRLGERGLPLMGSGDWNDGMNRVGIEGRGESVWLGFFLCQVLEEFGQLAQRYGDEETAESCRSSHRTLRESLDQHGWDGGWYRRAYFDDGTPLGMAAGSECRIDSISQIWAVLSGAGDPQRAEQAMEAVFTHLVHPEKQLIQLLSPPFDKATPTPGYIRGYVPGVRENGGQYTHAAIWAAMAYARLGQRERAWLLLDMLNPIHHSQSASGMARYRLEPYVMAADIYAMPPHVGRGGWSWYTGAAGWMYRLISESLLGLQQAGNRLTITPCLPADWTHIRMRYRFHGTTYCITIRQTADTPHPSSTTRLDGVSQTSPNIALCDDGQEHQVEILLGTE